MARRPPAAVDSIQARDDDRRGLRQKSSRRDSPLRVVEDSVRNRYLAAAICGFLLLAVAIVFGQTLGHGFVNFDDNPYVYGNEHVIRGLTVDGIVWAFTTNDCGNWHPLTWFSHMLDCQLYGLRAGGHHLTSVLLHAATAVLLFLVLWRMTGDLWPSAFVAAVFAVHPLRVESVAWVAERKDVLCGLFFVLTVAAYLAYVRRPFSILRYLAIVVLFALGLMTKPMLVTLPCVLLLLDYWPLGRMKGTVPFSSDENGDSPQDENWDSPQVSGRFAMPWRLVIEKLPLFALSAASCVIAPLAQGSSLADLESMPLSWRIGNALVSYVAYLRQFFVPVDLAVFYPHPKDGLPLWQIACAALLLTCISIGVTVARRKRPYLLVGWFWYLGMLVPAIGLVQVGRQAMADRYTYLPQIGLAIALAWGAKHLLASWPNRVWICGGASAAILAVLMGCACQQTSYWHDSETLWKHTLACTTDNYMAHYNLGVLFSRMRQGDEAMAEYRKAVDIKPDYLKARVNLGIGLFETGQLDEAIAQYREALKISPRNVPAHLNLGNALARQGKLDEAIATLQEALKIDDAPVDVRGNLGFFYYQQGNSPAAIEQWNEALRLQPNHVRSLTLLAWALATSPDASVRDGARAVELAERLVHLKREQDSSSLDVLAAAYAEANRFPEALETARRAVELARSQNDRRMVQSLLAKIPLYEAGTPFRDRLPLPGGTSVRP